MPLACCAIRALMAVIILLEGNRVNQNLSYAVTIRQRVVTKRFVEEIWHLSSANKRGPLIVVQLNLLTGLTPERQDNIFSGDHYVLSAMWH